MHQNFLSGKVSERFPQSQAARGQYPFKFRSTVPSIAFDTILHARSILKAAVAYKLCGMVGTHHRSPVRSNRTPVRPPNPLPCRLLLRQLSFHPQDIASPPNK